MYYSSGDDLEGQIMADRETATCGCHYTRSQEMAQHCASVCHVCNTADVVDAVAAALLLLL